MHSLPPPLAGPEGCVRASCPLGPCLLYLSEALVRGDSVHLDEAALFDVALSVVVRLVVVQIEGLLDARGKQQNSNQLATSNKTPPYLSRVLL